MGQNWFWLFGCGSAFFLLAASLVLLLFLLGWLLDGLFDLFVLVAGLTIDTVVATLLLEDRSSTRIRLVFDILPIFFARAHPTLLLDQLTILVLLTT